MAWLTNLIFLSLLYLFKCDCVINHQTLEEAWEKKLHKDLNRDHKWYENPNACNFTNVKVSFLMRSFIFDSDNDFFTLHSSMILSWIDERLTWNASDYGGLKKSHFKISNYWIPFLELSNGQDDDYSYFMYYEQCMTTDIGHVVCMLRTLYSVQCATNISKWPYDTQKCTLEFSISKLQKNVHLLPQGRRAVIRRGEATHGPEFTIIGYHQESNTSDEVQLRITFVLDRNGKALAAMIVFPSITLAVLTASSIILDVNDRNRLLMILFSMFCHCFFLLDIGWEIPKRNAYPPTILMFYRSSLIMTLLLIVATVILGKLRTKESAPFPWVSSVYSAVFNSYGKYFIWPRWKTNIELVTSGDVDVKAVDVWIGFANILNSACFFITVVVYFIMILVCVPKPVPYTYEPNNNSLFFAEDNF